MVSNARLQLIHVLDDVGRSPVGRADELAQDFSVSIDDIGFGISEGAINVAGLVRALADTQQVHTVIVNKLFISTVIGIFANCQDGHFIAQLFL